MTDKTLTCRDCGTSFVFTVGEQEFFANKGFTNEPSRCSNCRAARRQGRDGDGGRAAYDRPRREMFPAICAACGQSTQVPFEPRTDKPVYCSECFEQQRGGYASSRRDRR
ncbi:MAG: zinc-ribbon domain containing protein [Chloroflexi bacterium]|nr:zinc-ribbon domain containing protein [Chloroflexota bacterium]